jgi:hypothetical protein
MYLHCLLIGALLDSHWTGLRRIYLVRVESKSDLLLVILKKEKTH